MSERQRAADDFDAIRSRVAELNRERGSINHAQAGSGTVTSVTTGPHPDWCPAHRAYDCTKPHLRSLYPGLCNKQLQFDGEDDFA